MGQVLIKIGLFVLGATYMYFKMSDHQNKETGLPIIEQEIKEENLPIIEIDID